ncbi:hypothetical protein [Helicobacter ganmani]
MQVLLKRQSTLPKSKQWSELPCVKDLVFKPTIKHQNNNNHQCDSKR